MYFNGEFYYVTIKKILNGTRMRSGADLRGGSERCQFADHCRVTVRLGIGLGLGLGLGTVECRIQTQWRRSVVKSEGVRVTQVKPSN